MPFRPGTGIPYGKPAFAFSNSAAETRRTGPLEDSSSLGACDGCATADRVAAAAGAAREVGRRVACVFVG
jgi:hypothetical protein